MYGGCVLSPHSLLVFVISGIIKVEVRLRLITLIETKSNLIIVLLYIVLKKITTNALSPFHVTLGLIPLVV